MKQKELYVSPVTECITLNTRHQLLELSDQSGQAGGEDASAITGTW